MAELYFTHIEGLPQVEVDFSENCERLRVMGIEVPNIPPLKLRPYATVATLFRDDSTCFGLALCSHRDAFCPVKGSLIALGRLRKMREGHWGSWQYGKSTHWQQQHADWLAKLMLSRAARHGGPSWIARGFDCVARPGLDTGVVYRSTLVDPSCVSVHAPYVRRETEQAMRLLLQLQGLL